MLEAEGLDKSVKHVDDSELLMKHQSFFHEYHGISREFSNSGKGWAPSLGGFLLGEILMKHQRSIIMEISHPPRNMWKMEDLLGTHW